MNVIIPEKVLKDKELSPGEKIIIAILLLNPKMKNKEIAEMCGMSIIGAKLVKKRLKKRGILNKKQFTLEFFVKYDIDQKGIKSIPFLPDDTQKGIKSIPFEPEKGIKSIPFLPDDTQKGIKSIPFEPEKGIKSIPFLPDDTQKGIKSIPFEPEKGIKSIPFLPDDTQKGIKNIPFEPEKGIKSIPFSPLDATSLYNILFNLNNNQQVTSNTSNNLSTCNPVKLVNKKEKKKKTKIYLKSCLKEKEKKEITDENERAVNEAVRELLRYFDKVYKYIFDLGYYCEFKVEFDLLKHDYKRYYKENQDIEKTTRLFKRLIDCYFTLVEYDIKHNKDVNPTIRDFHRKMSQCIIQYKQNDYNYYEHLIEKQQVKQQQQEISSDTLSYDEKDTKNQDLPRTGYISNGFRHISEIIKGH